MATMIQSADKGTLERLRSMHSELTIAQKRIVVLAATFDELIAKTVSALGGFPGNDGICLACGAVARVGLCPNCNK